MPSFRRGGGFGTLGSTFEQPELPAAVEWRPVTAGAWLTLGLLGLLVVLGLALGVRRFRQRAPRRRALRALAGLETAPASLPLVFTLLKQVALDSFGRERVASLSGARWRDFLIASGPGCGFEGGAGEALIRWSERGAAGLSSEAIEPLFAASRAWIRRHRITGASSSNGGDS
ncbi:MAG TPA: DUF4381 domain-containing protein [Polyangiaceae bacterium]|nr:DUF4381 domain-containing protein [Polyangiaceae bacterium]